MTKRFSLDGTQLKFLALLFMLIDRSYPGSIFHNWTIICLLIFVLYDRGVQTYAFQNEILLTHICPCCDNGIHIPPDVLSRCLRTQ